MPGHFCFGNKSLRGEETACWWLSWDFRLGGQGSLLISLPFTVSQLPACSVRECDSQCLGLQGQGCMQGRVQGRGGWGLVAIWKEKETWQAEPWIPQPSLGNISDIFQPRVSGQAGIYGSAVSHDDLGSAELCVTPD